MVQDIASKSLDSQRKAWKAQGKFVCRHGVFFDVACPFACPCLGTAVSNDSLQWIDAKRMAALDHELKCIVTTPFDASCFSRLGYLRAEAKRLDW